MQLYRSKKKNPPLIHRNHLRQGDERIPDGPEVDPPSRSTIITVQLKWCNFRARKKEKNPSLSADVPEEDTTSFCLQTSEQKKKKGSAPKPWWSLSSCALSPTMNDKHTHNATSSLCVDCGRNVRKNGQNLSIFHLFSKKKKNKCVYFTDIFYDLKIKTMTHRVHPAGVWNIVVMHTHRVEFVPSSTCTVSGMFPAELLPQDVGYFRLNKKKAKILKKRNAITTGIQMGTKGERDFKMLNL